MRGLCLLLVVLVLASVLIVSVLAKLSAVMVVIWLQDLPDLVLLGLHLRSLSSFSPQIWIYLLGYNNSCYKSCIPDTGTCMMI